MVTGDMFAVVADPTRRQILDLLSLGERSVGELVDTLDLPQPNVSKHLKVLGQADLVRVRVDGPRRHYSLQPGQLRELDVWLAPYRRFWGDHLDRLERHLGEMEDSE